MVGEGNQKVRKMWEKSTGAYLEILGAEEISKFLASGGDSSPIPLAGKTLKNGGSLQKELLTHNLTTTCFTNLGVIDLQTNKQVHWK